MAGAQKKVILRLFSGDALSGYLPATGFVEAHSVTLMDTAGRAVPVPLRDIKMICYVRDFQGGDPADPERLGRRLFPARPRAEGTWLRLTFLDGETIEGLAAADITLLDPLLTDGCLSMTPPDARSNTHRLAIPRSALQAVEFLAVILPPGRRSAPAKQPREPQPSLFGDE